VEPVSGGAAAVERRGAFGPGGWSDRGRGKGVSARPSVEAPSTKTLHRRALAQLEAADRRPDRGDEYLEDDDSDLGTIVYHLRVLEAAGVIETADPPALGVVLGGDNAGEAVRRLGIADGRKP
jgi:hypothetical protein